MGNCFRRFFYPKKSYQYLNDLQASDDEVEVNKTNFLETFLNDIYDKECEIQASDNEIEFIKTGIEILAEKMVKCSQDDATKQHDTSPKDEDLASKPLFVKVGSFYEGTKNTFPDEFDIIFLDCPSIIDHTIDSLIYNLDQKFDESLKYTVSVDQHTRELYFNQYIGKNGPAYTSKFIYKNESGLERSIYLDLVPAVRHEVNETNRDEFTTYVTEQCLSLNSFRDEILNAGNYLEIAGKEYFSYTETEVHFMKKVLSPKHVKVYRILKSLINGDGDEKLLQAYLKHMDESTIFSSYMIKLNMFYHHDNCKNANDENLGDCVIQILIQLPRNHIIKPGGLSLSLPKHLTHLTCIIILMKMSDNDRYDYKSSKLKSVPRLYFDELDRNVDTGKHTLWFDYKARLDEKDEPSYYSFIKSFGIPKSKDDTYVKKIDFKQQTPPNLFPLYGENLFFPHVSEEFQSEHRERCMYVVVT